MNRLRELRRGLKESQQDIAKILGITQQAYSYYEADKRNMDPESLKILSNHFGVSVDYIIGNSDTKEKTPSEESVSFDDFTYAMYRQSKDLSEEAKKMLLDMATMLKEKKDGAGQSDNGK